MIAIGERHSAWTKQDSKIPSTTCLGKIPLRTKYKNFAQVQAQAKYLCISSAHMSQDEKINLTIQTVKFPLIRLGMSLLALLPFSPMDFFLF